jgi:predicted lipid-binding transport protein (Tim44 family)
MLEFSTALACGNGRFLGGCFIAGLQAGLMGLMVDLRAIFSGIISCLLSVILAGLDCKLATRFNCKPDEFDGWV